MENEQNIDAFFMRAAIKEAEKALEMGEVPIGAVLVSRGKIVARAHNLVETLCDPTAHAEMQVITSATNSIGAKYLQGCTLYVTIEPCVMCSGACYWAQIEKIVYGADDIKRGFSVIDNRLVHPKTVILKGILADECAKLMTDFFKTKRN